MYQKLPPVPAFDVVRDDIADGRPLNRAQLHHGFGADGGNPPHRRWQGFSAETKEFVVTCHDPDAPTGSGFWHWLWGIPSHVTEL